jgi:hypothetical protein
MSGSIAQNAWYVWNTNVPMLTSGVLPMMKNMQTMTTKGRMCVLFFLVDSVIYMFNVSMIVGFVIKYI